MAHILYLLQVPEANIPIIRESRQDYRDVYMQLHANFQLFQVHMSLGP